MPPASRILGQALVMAPRIDPTLPLVWRSPTDVQLGATSARVVLPRAGALELSLVTALRAGVSVPTLITMGTGLGATEAQVRELLDTLEPAFEREPDAGRAPGAGRAPRRGDASSAGAQGMIPAASTRDRAFRVGLDADGLVARHLTANLEALGHEPILLRDDGDDDAPLPDLVVVAAAWVVAPARHLPLLRRDLPHLAIVFDDTGARVGPLVEPGSGPCLRCLDLAKRDADSAWPVIAAQLAGRPAASCTARAALDVSALAVGVIDDRLARGARRLADASLTLERPGALPRRQRHEPHPECGCRAPAGIATAPVRLGTRRSHAPSSGRAGAVPA